MVKGGSYCAKGSGQKLISFPFSLITPSLPPSATISLPLALDRRAEYHALVRKSVKDGDALISECLHHLHISHNDGEDGRTRLLQMPDHGFSYSALLDSNARL